MIKKYHKWKFDCMFNVWLFEEQSYKSHERYESYDLKIKQLKKRLKRKLLNTKKT
jgi:hypothetical protein